MFTSKSFRWCVNFTNLQKIPTFSKPASCFNKVAPNLKHYFSEKINLSTESSFNEKKADLRP